MITSLLVIIISVTMDATTYSGIVLTQTKYVLIQELNGGLAAQEKVAFQQVLPWVSLSNWPITTNVCFTHEFLT